MILPRQYAVLHYLEPNEMLFYHGECQNPNHNEARLYLHCRFAEDITSKKYDIELYTALRNLSRECSSAVCLTYVSIASTLSVLDAFSDSPGPTRLLNAYFETHPDIHTIDDFARTAGIGMELVCSTGLNLEAGAVDMLCLDSLNVFPLYMELLREFQASVKKYIFVHGTNQKFLVGDYQVKYWTKYLQYDAEDPDFANVKLACARFTAECPEWEVFAEVASNYGAIILKRKPS
jgi:hypothetical protein